MRNIAALTAALRGDHVNAQIADTPGGIERQELAGQQSFVTAEPAMMPADLKDDRETLERFGFKFGRPANELFLYALLPNGWTRRATDHAMWSQILDERGRERVEVFYKAAFYDRSAFARAVSRFQVASEDAAFVVTDGRQVELARFEHAPRPKDGFGDDSAARIAYVRMINQVEDEARAWLVARFPDWQNPAAYWD